MTVMPKMAIILTCKLRRPNISFTPSILKLPLVMAEGNLQGCGRDRSADLLSKVRGF